jgi:hypothetical protein
MRVTIGHKSFHANPGEMHLGDEVTVRRESTKWDAHGIAFLDGDGQVIGRAPIGVSERISLLLDRHSGHHAEALSVPEGKADILFYLFVQEGVTPMRALSRGYAVTMVWDVASKRCVSSLEICAEAADLHRLIFQDHDDRCVLKMLDLSP